MYRDSPPSARCRLVRSRYGRLRGRRPLIIAEVCVSVVGYSRHILLTVKTSLIELVDAEPKQNNVGHSLRLWMAHFIGGKEATPINRDLEGYEEALEQFLESLPLEQRLAGLPAEELVARLRPEERLAGLPAEERLAGLPPEERLAGLSPDESILALSNEVLERLPLDFIVTLPKDVQSAIRERIRH